ncbi:MAG: hypothetical protein VCA57_04370 [Pseudomonas sp.]|uniref:hypothetical protein n=1 Tax=Pseudomonas sp. TaxID=306 RepID=UPI003981BA9E
MNKPKSEVPMERPEYDPWEWLQGDDPANNPGDLLKSCAFQAHRVIEANKGSPEMQKQALDLLNMAVGMFTSFDWKSQDGTISEDAVRRSLKRLSYLTSLLFTAA